MTLIRSHPVVEISVLRGLASGRLIEVLPKNPPLPFLLLAFYPQNRQLSPRVRVFLDWIVDVFEKAEF